MIRSNVTLLFCVACFLAGVVLVAWLASFGDLRHSLAKSLIAECAVQEDPTLRETTGTATYNVTFQDGDWVEITCANEVAE